MTTAQRKFWGWGTEDQIVSDEERKFLTAAFAKRFATALPAPVSAPKVEDILLRAPRVAVPSNLQRIATTDPRERLIHAYGKSFPDSVRMFQRHVPFPPDVVVYPENEGDISAVFDWAAHVRAAVIPFGGGSSVVGGVE